MVTHYHKLNRFRNKGRMINPMAVYGINLAGSRLREKSYPHSSSKTFIHELCIST